MTLWIVLLDLILIAGAVGSVIHKPLKRTVLIYGGFSLIAALSFALMGALDVALAQVLLSTFLTLALFLWTLSRLEEDGYGAKE